jgi:hypothetical protein
MAMGVDDHVNSDSFYEISFAMGNSGELRSDFHA